MFFASALKDYADQLNDLAVLFHDNFNFFVFFKILVIYLFNSVKLGLMYIISFQWLTDFIELPCYFKLNFISILKGDNLAESYVNPTFFEFLEPKAINSNPFLTGIFNSFFLALPFSVPHLLTFRAFLMNGLPAGIFSAAGTILGQFTFFLCVLFGLESILIPFLTFEPFNYILGFVLVINVLYNMTHNSNREVLNIKHSQDVKLLINFFFLNFGLAWTEQTSLFQYFGNLTVNTLPTLLQGTEESLTTFSDYFLPNTFYLIGILIGSVAWTAFFGFLLTIFLNRVSQLFKIPFLFLNERIHKLLLVLTFTFCFTSVPYYGFDYLVSAPLGFLSQDKALNFLKAKNYYFVPSLSNEDALLHEQALNSIPFDRPSQMEKSFKPEFFVYNFEDLSVDPENLWKNKSFREPRSSVKTAQKTTVNTRFEEEIITREKAFESNFYKSSYDAVLQMKPENAVQGLEKKIDKLASKLFSPVAYNYYNLVKSPMDANKKVVRQQFRERFYQNPVYKALVNLDMIGFLQCQPKAYNLTAKEEEFLFTQRVLLQNYLNSVMQYKNLSAKKLTSTSYAEKVYNQQFKGSLDLVRHYFSISLTSANDLNKMENFAKVLKFDQPLYKNSLSEINPFLHEELNFKQQKNEKVDPWIPLIDSTPFYIGWDSSLRKFLVKNSCTPGLSLGTESLPTFSINTSSKYPTYYLSFQSWPNTASDLKKLVDKNKNVSLAYTPISDENITETGEFLGLKNMQYKKTVLKNSNLLIQKNLPSYDWKWVLTSLNFQQDLASKSSAVSQKNSKPFIDLGNTLPPQLDGFSWPGAYGLKKFVLKSN